MQKRLICSFLMVSFLSFQFMFAQQKKPKVALVLSGGGAKGIAHVPLLQTLDSLGIVPDLIVGTSMGSAVGGLYAIGYSGDSIAKIAQEANWDLILSGETSLTDVEVAEKSEYRRYTVNLDIVKGQPKIKNALIKDQNLREFLTSLVYPVYKIDKFDDYYIPFRAVTTDLVHGKEVVLDSGSLSTAIRASISIPGVFEPVKHNGTLLVDGGVVNNFPTDVAKQLGADIIIGSDVGEGLLPEEKLDNLPAILFQTSMLTSSLKVDSNRELCRVLITHNEHLTYSTQDFVKAKEIYEQGRIGTNQSRKDLEELAEYLQQFESTPREKNFADKVSFDALDYKGISKNNLDFIKARMDLETGVDYSIEELKEAVDRAMGTEIFEQMTFRATGNSNYTKVEFTGIEKANNQIGGSIHYDTYQGVGLVLNYTGRNILGKASRLLVGIDIAEQPKLRVQYQKHFGTKRMQWLNLQFFTENLKQNFYDNGLRGELLKTRYLQAYAQINSNINPLKDYFGLDVSHNYQSAEPIVNPDVNNNVYDLRNAQYESFNVSAYYIRNTFNKVFFPTRGTYLIARVSRSLHNDMDVEFQQNTDLNAKGSTNNITRFTIDAEKRFALNQDTFILRGTVGLTFEDQLNQNQFEYFNYGQLNFYQLGGQLPPNKRYAYTFKGLANGDLLTSQFARVFAGYQLSPFRKFYATPYFDGAVVGFDDVNEFFENIFKANNNWQEAAETSFVYSLGTTFSYNSLLGPVNLDLAYVSARAGLEVYFGVGLNINLQK